MAWWGSTVWFNAVWLSALASSALLHMRPGLTAAPGCQRTWQVWMAWAMKVPCALGTVFITSLMNLLEEATSAPVTCGQAGGK